MDVPVDPDKFRSRRTLKVLIGDGPELVETEPNDTARAGHAGSRSLRGQRTHLEPVRQPDVDLFKFNAKKGQNWVMETQAAQRGSPVDTKLEILHADGTPVEQVALQADPEFRH